MSEYKAEIEHRIRNFKCTRRVFLDGGNEETAKIYTGHIEVLESILETVANESYTSENKALDIDPVSDCVGKCTDFTNVESMLFQFWSKITNDVECVNSENIVSKIKEFCEEENNCR